MNIGSPVVGSGFIYNIFSHSFSNCEEREGEIVDLYYLENKLHLLKVHSIFFTI